MHISIDSAENVGSGDIPSYEEMAQQVEGLTEEAYSDIVFFWEETGKGYDDIPFDTDYVKGQLFWWLQDPGGYLKL
jgi:hypothetical protein